MKLYLVILLLLVLGCMSYHPERYITSPCSQFWSAREKEYCPKCKGLGMYLKSYSSARPTKFLYYYRCIKHYWIIIEYGDQREVHLIKELK